LEWGICKPHLQIIMLIMLLKTCTHQFFDLAENLLIAKEPDQSVFKRAKKFICTQVLLLEKQGLSNTDLNAQ
jgi:hypothetical protein